MKKQKILAVCGATYVSGQEIVTLRFMEGLIARGYEVHFVVSGWNDGDFIQRLRERGIPYTKLWLGFVFLRHPYWTFASLVRWPGCLLQFARLKRSFRPDWMVFTTYRSMLMLWPLVSGRTAYNVQEMPVLNRRAKFAFRTVARKTSVFVAPSEFILDCLRQVCPADSKLAIVPNCLEPVKAHPVSHRFESPVIGIVGQIGVWKGHDVLLEALATLAAKGRAFQLQIVGKGEEDYVAQLRTKVRRFGLDNRVEWLGFKSDLHEIYADLDVVVVPTVKPEPFGLVAIEPSLWEIPVVASRAGGLAEIIVDGVTGLLFTPNDAADLASKLELLILDPALRARLGARARERVQARYSQQAATAVWESVLENTPLDGKSGEPQA